MAQMPANSERALTNYIIVPLRNDYIKEPT